MKTLAIIPARYCSSRFPGKPLIDIAGKSMIIRVYEQAKKAFEDVCVATDDLRIFDKVCESGGVAIMTSDKHKSGTDRVFEAYNKYIDANKEKKFDLLMNVQGDEPLINPEQLLSLESIFFDRDVMIGTMAKKIVTPSELFDKNNVKTVLDKNGYALYFSRYPIPYMRDIDEDKWMDNHCYLKHIGLYAYRPSALKEICSLERSSLEIAESLEQLRWLENGMRIKVEITQYDSISVDTPSDLDKILKYLNKK
jgi:3-deoxy-manno-octulosonate cytidylyltransferase (CMP-KDO synthetase)